MILIKALMRKTRGLKWRSEYLWHLVLFIGGLAFGFSLLASLLAGDIYDYQDTVIQDDLPEIDAIVCLGGGRGRIGAAGDLWYRYWEAVQRSRLDAQKIPENLLHTISVKGKSTLTNRLTRELVN